MYAFLRVVMFSQSLFGCNWWTGLVVGVQNDGAPALYSRSFS